MSDAPTPDPFDGAVLSAYLTGELDADTAAVVEARLAHDHALGRRLDTTARMLGALRGVEEVEPPPGAAERLRRRLAEAGAPHAAGAAADPADRSAPAHRSDGTADAADTPAPAPVTTLASRRRTPWSAVAGVAAGLAALALVGGGLIQGFGGSNEQTADSAAEAPPADGGDMRQFEGAEESGLADEQADDDATGRAPAPAPSGEALEGQAGDGLPVLRDEAVVLADEAAVRARYTDLAEAAALLGRSLDAAEEPATAARAVLAAAPTFQGGTAPGACLDEAGAVPPAVPVLVESAVLEGRSVLVYVLVGASPDATTLDRVTVQAHAVSDCTGVLALELAAPGP
ncbi:MAG: hypothetical protein WD080_13150 [Egibacteraceae bacterium]